MPFIAYYVKNYIGRPTDNAYIQTWIVKNQVMQILLDSGFSCSAISKQHVQINKSFYQFFIITHMTVTLGELSIFIAVDCTHHHLERNALAHIMLNLKNVPQDLCTVFLKNIALYS